MTKEETLERCCKEGAFELTENVIDAYTPDVYMAMDKYAKQEAIGFLIWNATKIFEYVDWIKNKKHLTESSEEEYAKNCEITAFELSTIEKRYRLYIEQKNKKP